MLNPAHKDYIIKDMLSTYTVSSVEKMSEQAVKAMEGFEAPGAPVREEGETATSFLKRYAEWQKKNK